MSDPKTFRVTIIVSGRVQGVGYRQFTAAEARRLGLDGYAKNVRDGRVEVRLEGDRETIETAIGRLRIGPSSARVESVDVRWQDGTSGIRGFSVE